MQISNYPILGEDPGSLHLICHPPPHEESPLRPVILIVSCLLLLHEDRILLYSLLHPHHPPWGIAHQWEPCKYLLNELTIRSVNKQYNTYFSQFSISNLLLPTLWSFTIHSDSKIINPVYFCDSTIPPSIKLS